MQDLFDNIAIFKSNRHYRLGDIIFAKGNRFEYDRSVILNQPEFKNTFLHKYLTHKDPTQEIDLNLLKKIIYNHRSNIKTDNNTLYINLRLGDSIMKGVINSHDTYAEKHGLFAHYDKNLYIQISNHINQNKSISKIQIISALHFGDNDLKNIWKFDKNLIADNRAIFNKILKNIQTKFNLPVILIKNDKDQICHIDEDFLVLCCAKNVILDGGGFGESINLIRSIQ